MKILFINLELIFCKERRTFCFTGAFYFFFKWPSANPIYPGWGWEGPSCHPSSFFSITHRIWARIRKLKFSDFFWLTHVHHLRLKAGLLYLQLLGMPKTKAKPDCTILQRNLHRWLWREFAHFLEYTFRI